MKVVLYGATGKAGSRILQELLKRGHHVSAVTRDPKKLAPAEGLVIVTGDLSDVSSIAKTIEGVDAVMSAYAPPFDHTDDLVEVTKRLIEAVGSNGTRRLLVVGGAGSLEVSPGVTLIDSGYLPADWLGIARSHSKALAVYRSSDIDWTVLSPSAYFGPGERTGKFRLATETLLSNEKGESIISMEDYAIAMVDELENGQYRRKRFTVGY
jgi:putative NADH-flavin reductase